MNIKLGGSLVIAIVSLALPSFASTLVLPAACAAADCPGNTPAVNLPVAFEIQQVFDAALFTGITGPITITGIGLRPTPNSNTATSGIVNLTLKAETTAQDANAGCSALPTQTGCTYNSILSTAGATTVFSGPDSFATTNTGSPRPFDYNVTFSTTFNYDPTGGANLLLDLVIPANGVSGIFPVGASLGFEAIGGANRQSGTGGVIFSALTGASAVSGLVVNLNYNAAAIAPEPASFALIGGSLLALGFLMRKRARRAVGQ